MRFGTAPGRHSDAQGAVLQRQHRLEDRSRHAGRLRHRRCGGRILLRAGQGHPRPLHGGGGRCCGHLLLEVPRTARPHGTGHLGELRRELVLQAHLPARVRPYHAEGLDSGQDDGQKPPERAVLGLVPHEGMRRDQDAVHAVRVRRDEQHPVLRRHRLPPDPAGNRRRPPSLYSWRHRLRGHPGPFRPYRRRHHQGGPEGGHGPALPGRNSPHRAGSLEPRRAASPEEQLRGPAER